MRMPTILTVSAYPVARSTPGPVLRAGKSSDGNGLGDETRPRNGAEAEPRATARDPRASRYETAECAPLWYGPKLRPLFVTQLLGQTLAPMQARHSAVVAYGEHARKIAPAALLDTRA